MLTRERLLANQWGRLVNLGGGPEEWGGWWWDHEDIERVRAGRTRFWEWVAEQDRLNGNQQNSRISLYPEEASCRLVEAGDNLIPHPEEPYLTIGPSIMGIKNAAYALGVPERKLRAWKERYVLDVRVIREILHWYVVQRRRPTFQVLDSVAQFDREIFEALSPTSKGPP